jgi:hypothetical protein
MVLAGVRLKDSHIAHVMFVSNNLDGVKEGCWL